MNRHSQTEIEMFVERIGLSSEADGLPRIAGRMMGFFVIHGGPCSFSQLANELQISRGSVSTNARLLAGLGVIERVSRPGDRQDYYQLTKNPYDRFMQGILERMRQKIAIVQEAREAIADAEIQRRLQDMEGFYLAMNDMALDVLTKLRQETKNRCG